MALADLVSKMKGKNTLLGWDMLVSYNVDTLNRCLSQKVPIGSPDPAKWVIAWETVIPDIISGEDVKMKFTLTCSQPTLQFNGITGTVELNWPFQYLFACGGKEQSNLNDGMKLVVSSSAGHVTGSWIPDPGTNPGPLDEPIIVRDGVHSGGTGTCLHFTNTTAHVTFTGLVPSLFDNWIASSIEKWFQRAAGVKYYLGFSKETNDLKFGSNDVGFLFQLNSLRLSFYPDANATTLSMWIELKRDSPAGERTQDPKFKPDGANAIDPIPSGQTASIIFSHNSMAELYLIPALGALVSDVSCTSKDGTGPMAFSFSFHNPGILPTGTPSSITGRCTFIKFPGEDYAPISMNFSITYVGGKTGMFNCGAGWPSSKIAESIHCPRLDYYGPYDPHLSQTKLLRYDVVANLLYPRGQIFNADDTSIEFAPGFVFPRDIILIGNIKLPSGP